MPDGGARARFLPYGRQEIDASDLAAVAEALQGEFLTTGPIVERFEAAIRSATGAAHAVVCSNGTAALHLAVKALGIGPGDVAVVPSITFVATANCVRFEGADVVFADVDPTTGLMTPETLADALDRAPRGRVRAVLPVHLTGAAADVPALRLLAESVGATVVEDACHALGTVTPWGPVGSCRASAAACFSFHPVKTVTTGEGGAVATNDAELASRMRRARSHGLERTPDRFTQAGATDDGAAAPWWYEQTELGFNYRLPDVLCALGLSQIARLDRFTARRAALAARYRMLLEPLAPLVQPPPTPEGCEPALHLFAVRIDFAAAGVSRRRVWERLRAAGIGTQVHYIPVHRQPYWRAASGEIRLPGAEAYYHACLSLPLFPAMADDDPDRVVEALREALGSP